MATDIGEIIKNLCATCDFREKTIISFGAGGGQLVDYSRIARKVTGVDNDPAAIESLKQRLKQKNLENKFAVILADFFDVKLTADIVLFEFSLHEIDRSAEAIQHAKELAPEVAIIDHALASEWAYYVVEEAKVAASTQALQRAGIRRQKDFHTLQIFKNYAELAEKVAPQGQTAIERIGKFKNTAPIEIPMSYSIILL